jgi:hypothetical protein
MPLIDPETFFAELEAAGEIAIRNRLATNAIYGGDKKPLVEEWLRRKDQERADAFNAEQLAVARADAAAARDAADAARDAAREAKTANRIAKAAIVIAIISTIIAIFRPS